MSGDGADRGGRHHVVEEAQVHEGGAADVVGEVHRVEVGEDGHQVLLAFGVRLQVAVDLIPRPFFDEEAALLVADDASRSHPQPGRSSKKLSSAKSAAVTSVDGRALARAFPVTPAHFGVLSTALVARTDASKPQQ